jgi:8-oxo-dGTP pyrophosphatase MutT (NUDIX family)
MEWNMPGGSVDDGEGPEKASRREVIEEVGLNLSNLQALGRRGTTYYFYGEADTLKLVIARAEIYEANWFDWGNLPRPLSSEVKRVKRLHQRKNFL